MTREELLRQLTTQDWEHARSNGRASSAYVPAAFQRLIEARTEDEAKRAYWELDNRVVTQGRLFQSAGLLVPYVLDALTLPVSTSTRHRLVELLTEMALAVTSDEEARAGNVGLSEAVRAKIRAGIAAVYALLTDDDARIRRAALYTLDVVELDRKRFSSVLARLDRDPDEEVREFVRSHASS